MIDNKLGGPWTKQMSRNWSSCTKWLTINRGALDRTGDNNGLEVMHQKSMTIKWGALDQTDVKKLEVIYQMVD
jgi:hypothetical protein